MMDRRSLFKTLAAGAVLPVLGAAAPVTHRISDRAQSPPLGWNSFDSYGVYLHEKAALANLDAMARKLRPAGYEYFVVDNGWFGEYKLVPGTLYPAEKHASDLRINEYGLVQPSKTYFPGGIEALASRAHSLGLKFGVHLMRGIPRKAVEQNLPIQGTKYRAQEIANTGSICKWCHYNYGVDMSKPGAQAFYNSLVNQLARWGVDFIKADDIVPYPREILGFANAIEQCGREMVFSLSPGGTVNRSHLPYYRRANMFRTTGDIWDRRSDLDKGFAAWKEWGGTDYPGFWPDLDMIPFGQLLLMSPEEYAEKGSANLAGHGYKRQCQLTQDQMRTFITQRALSASPLFPGGDLPTLDDFSVSLLTNHRMLACNQNGVMGVNVHARDDVEVWLTPRTNQPGHGWLGIFNRSASKETVTLGAEELGLDKTGAYKLHNIWNGESAELQNGGHGFTIAPDGVTFLAFDLEA